ncbi:MAG: ribosome maturation factor RimM [Egibacteraceae bacterium]
MTAGSDDEFVVAGVVGKPFGIRGEVFVFPDPDIADEFAVGGHYPILGKGSATGSDEGELRVAASHDHGGRRIVRFEGVEDRNTAEALRGTVLGVPRSRVRVAEDAVWTADLIGREVVDDDGAIVGVVEGALDGTAHDYLVVACPGRGSLLIPAVIELVDVDADPIVLHPIPGLLDEQEAW